MSGTDQHEHILTMYNCYGSGPLFWGDCTLVGIDNEISVSVVATTLSMQKTRIMKPASEVFEVPLQSKKSLTCTLCGVS